MKKRNKWIDILLIIIIIVLAILIVKRNIDSKVEKEYKTVDSVAALGDPIQEEYDDNEELKIQSYEYKLHFIYEYQISGRVVKTRKYLPTSAFSAISPIDVGMVWGKYVKDENIKDLKFINYGDRLLRIAADNGSFITEHPDFNTHMSHNHLIPSNDDIKKKLRQIKKDDLIEITGYLTDVEATNFKATLNFPTSTRRDDDGKGACETIYVTDIKWLKEE